MVYLVCYGIYCDPLIQPNNKQGFAVAVYTPVPPEELKAFLSLYDIESLVSYEGIEQGVSNTNYHVFTMNDRFILTLFEPHRVHEEDIEGFMNYTIVLEKAGVPCPKTLVQKNGSVAGRLMGRPAALFSFLQGDGGNASMLTPSLCEKAGAVLAAMHKAAPGVAGIGPNHFGLERWRAWVEDLSPAMHNIAPGLNEWTKAEYDWVADRWPRALPAGAIHADYFPDNVFFKDGEVSGVIDFHFVCRDFLAYDLAIAINAWTFDARNDFQDERMDAMMRGYQSVRPLSQAEKDSLPVLLRGAGLRFLLSRIEEKLAWTPGCFMVPHDPMVFEKRLRHFQSFPMDF